jgi:hypothetical protein
VFSGLTRELILEWAQVTSVMNGGSGHFAPEPPDIKKLMRCTRTQLFKRALENQDKMSRLPISSTASTLLVSARLLEACGLDLGDLFGLQLVAWRSIETVLDDAVELLVSEQSIWVWAHLVPPRLQVGQWLRFERRGALICVSVDLRATIRGESRLTNLFEVLTAQPGSFET